MFRTLRYCPPTPTATHPSHIDQSHELTKSFPAVRPLQSRQRRGHLQSHRSGHVRSEYVPRSFPHHDPHTRPTEIELTQSLKTEGKAKQKAWQKEADAGTSQADAEKRYVALVEKLKGAYGYDANKKAEAVGGS